MMKLLYAILIVLSLATQGVATRLLSESEGSAQPVAKTEGVTQESALSRWVGQGKAAAFWVAGVSVLPMSLWLLNEYENIVKQRENKDFSYGKWIVVWFIGSVVGLGLGIVETAWKRGKNLSQNQNLARELMMVAPAVVLSVMLFKEFSRNTNGIIIGLSGFVFLGGALWSMKDWYQKWRHSKADAEVEVSKDKAFA